MKTQEVAEKIGPILYVRLKRNAKEIFEELKTAPMPQVYGALKMLVDQKVVRMYMDKENIKTYELTKIGQAAFKGKWIGTSDETTPEAKDKTDEVSTETSSNNEESPEPNDEKKKLEQKPTGRDLTKYSFNGLEELSKGRLALAVIRSIAVTNPKIKLKELVEVYPDTLVPPYGVIKPKKEALEISKGRPRFFIKQEEMVKLADADICVSNQWTTERINEFISISKKKFGLKIK